MRMIQEDERILTRLYFGDFLSRELFREAVFQSTNSPRPVKGLHKKFSPIYLLRAKPVVECVSVYNSLAAKELKTNERPILAVRDRDSPYFDLLGTKQD